MRQQRDSDDLVARRLMWLLLASTALFGCSVAGAEWDYSDGSHGPRHWADSYSACGGKKQSPINIEQGKATYKDIGSLTLSGYDITSGHGFQLENNGHTVQLSVQSGPEMTVSGGGLSGTYKLQQFHFHWSKTNDKGSEHQIDGKSYPLEIHFVHYNKKYSDITAALGHEDGIAVLGIFAQVGSQANTGLDNLFVKFEDVKHKDQRTGVNSFALNSILPSNISNFARYPGSLTTPGCNESVTWTVFASPITVTSQQVDKFRTLRKGTTDEMLADNFRPIQALNDRTVHLTYSVGSAPTINIGHLSMSGVVSMAALIWALAARY